MPCPYLPVMYKYHLLTVLVHLTILLGELYQFLSGIHYMISKFGSIARVFVTFQHPDLSCTGSTKSQTSKIYYSWFTIFAINMFGRWKSCHSGIFPLTRHHLQFQCRHSDLPPPCCLELSAYWPAACSERTSKTTRSKPGISFCWFITSGYLT